MNTITMNDGTVLEDSNILDMNGSLCFFVRNGMTMAEVFALFNDPEKTATITETRYEQEKTYEGYTDLNMIQKNYAGQISGILMKPRGE